MVYPRLGAAVNFVGAVYVRENFSDRGESLDRDIAADLEGDEDLGEVRILADANALSLGNRDDLLGDRAATAGDNAWQGQGAAIMPQGNRDVVDRRQSAQRIRLIRRGTGRRLTGLTRRIVFRRIGHASSFMRPGIAGQTTLAGDQQGLALAASRRFSAVMLKKCLMINKRFWHSQRGRRRLSAYVPNGSAGCCRSVGC